MGTSQSTPNERRRLGTSSSVRRLSSQLSSRSFQNTNGNRSHTNSSSNSPDFDLEENDSRRHDAEGIATASRVEMNVSLETSQKVASMREQRIQQARKASSQMQQSFNETGVEFFRRKQQQQAEEDAIIESTQTKDVANRSNFNDNQQWCDTQDIQDHEDVEDDDHDRQAENESGHVLAKKNQPDEATVETPDTSSAWIPPIFTPVAMTTGEENDNSAFCHDTQPTHDYSTAYPSSYVGAPAAEEYTYYGGGYGPDGSYYITPPASQPVPDFFPQGSRHNEWMGRSLETLILGYASVVPILCLPGDEEGGTEEDTAFLWGATRRRSTVSTLGSCGDYGPRGSMGSGAGYGRRGSLVGGGRRMHGGTSANYYNGRRNSGGRRDSTASGSGRRGSVTGMASRRGSASHGPSYHRRRMNMSRSSSGDSDDAGLNSGGGGAAGPNIALSLLARETTGKLSSINRMSESSRLKALGGFSVFNRLDRPAAGMCSEVAFLSEVIDSGDWAETQTVVSRLTPRLMGDPASMIYPGMERRPAAEDPNLPPLTPRFYAGGGRVGLERDAFVLAGGVDALIRVFREKSFVGAEMAETYDARDLSEELVASRLAPCWNETLICLRELVYSIPSLVEDELIFDNGDFLPFLFTLLSHDSCFDSAAALIEEILSLQSHSPSVQIREEDDLNDEGGSMSIPKVRVAPPTTFFLGNVPDLYKLWSGFNCRQLAHFCRILALLVFEPEDRQLLESPAVLKSIDLLQLRRNRAARAGRDSTVDMNQSILLGDGVLLQRLLQLLGVMNYAPPVRQSSPFHVMAQNPFIADTLVMLGLKELTNWQEVSRLDRLAKLLLQNESNDATSRCGLAGLGSVATMLDNVSTVLASQNEPNNQLGQIIRVISAAQQAGVVVGRSRHNHESSGEGIGNTDHDGISGESAGALRDLSSTLGMMTEEVRSPRNSSTRNGDEPSGASNSGPNRSCSPTDAANILQFNALLLGAFQVEVLFVLCTLLGGRRKIDAQESLRRRGIIPILEDMFERLPWDSLSSSREIVSNSAVGNVGGVDSSENQPTGIHGPGCECTPESALCVQYLRLLHNFCDRDCDNYAGRRLLLSPAEREAIFSNSETADYDISTLRPGLLSKIIAAFTGESDESPYRFWLASCVESYLRGSSPPEQVFVVRTGLMAHLMDEVTSQRLHCAGSLQTSFDLLGELCKGNTEVLKLLVSSLDEEKFRKLMSVAAANLVDSNVFIRSILLSLERISSANSLLPLHFEGESRGEWKSFNGTFSRTYLTHSWWDTCLVNRRREDASNRLELSEAEIRSDEGRPSDWFPTMKNIEAYDLKPPETVQPQSVNLHSGVGHFGWVFAPEGESLSSATLAPNTVERLSWFLAANQTRLLRDLLSVVDLTNINHENICCLNTAVVVTIFAYRRSQLHSLLQDLKRMNDEERETKRRATNAATTEDDVIDRAFVQAMKYMSLDLESQGAPYARRASLTRRSSLSLSGNQEDQLGAQSDVTRNFREVLWFWMEYYTHRGRDRLSLEFSSHLRFQEWMEVVTLLAADNDSSTALVPSPIPLPRSPYQRAA